MDIRKFFLFSLILVGSMFVLSGCVMTEVGLENPNEPGTILLKLGPIKLKPSRSEGHANHSKMKKKVGLFKFKNKGWITSFSPRMTDGKGTALRRDLLHHVAFGDHDGKDYLCEDLPHDIRLMFAAGSEMTGFQLPEGYGIPLEKNMKMIAEGMFMNPTKEKMTAFFEANLGFTPAASGIDLDDVIPVWIDVNPTCDENGYKVSKGEVSLKRRVFRFPFSGRIILAGGHMHNGGKRVSIVGTRESKIPILNFEPVYSGHQIDRIPSVESEVGISIRADTDYVIESVHENRTSYNETMAMGIILVFMVPGLPPKFSST